MTCSPSERPISAVRSVLWLSPSRMWACSDAGNAATVRASVASTLKPGIATMTFMAAPPPPSSGCPDGASRSNDLLSARGVDEPREPQLEHQQGPQLRMALAHPAVVLVHQPPDRLGREQSPLTRDAAEQRVLDHAAHGPLQPARDRRAESLLRPRQDRVGDEIADGALEDVLLVPPAQLEGGR